MSSVRNSLQKRHRTQPDLTELNRTLKTDIEHEFGDRRIIRYSVRFEIRVRDRFDIFTVVSYSTLKSSHHFLFLDSTWRVIIEKDGFKRNPSKRKIISECSHFLKLFYSVLYDPLAF